MPLRDDLLNPIPGENPSGVSLRYERVYDQIKEARTEDDESIPSGAWERQAKKADFALVVKLAGEALATKSKDLQLVAWLTEAHVKREGIGLVQPCFKLMRDLQEQFWETLHPEIEDGDAGMRAVPIEWASNRVAAILHEAPITRDGLNFFQYKESRAIGYEADAESNDAKREARERAINDGKVTGEEFDKSFGSTPKSFYVNLDTAINATTETLNDLQVYCEGKYGDDGPGFSRLHAAMEEVGQVVRTLLSEKRKLEPDEPVAEVEEEEPEAEAESEPEETEEASAAAAKPKKGKTLSAEPENWDDAVRRIQACAAFLQKERASSPVGYLLQTSIRFGEMREQGSSPSYDFLASPPTEVRQTLKRLSSEGNWEELLRPLSPRRASLAGGRGSMFIAMCGRRAMRRVIRRVSAAVIATVQSLLKDIPEIPTWTLDDDTPTANAETQRWLEEMVIPKPPEPVVQEAQPEPEPVQMTSFEPDGAARRRMRRRM